MNLAKSSDQSTRLFDNKRDSSVKSLSCYVKSSVDCKGLGLRNSSFRCPIITVCDHGIQSVKKANHLSKSSEQSHQVSW